MAIVGFIIGILSMIPLLIGLIPLLGWLNWLNIPFALAGLIFAIVGVSRQEQNQGLGIAGIVLCAIAIIVGGIRLVLGGGLL